MAVAGNFDDTPFMPIDQFDPTEIQELTFRESDAGRDSGFVDIPGVLDQLPSNATDLGRDGFSRDVAEILYGMGMEKYFDLFKNEDINLETFLQLNYNDLNQLGVTNPDDQDKMVNYLKDLKNDKLDFFTENQGKQFIVPLDPDKDFVIAKNILNQILILKIYGSCTILKMKKNELYDYFVSRDQTAVGILKLLAEQTLIQADRISDTLYDGNLKGDSLVAVTTKAYKKELPKQLLEKLTLKNPKQNIKRKKVVGVVGGVCLLIIAVLVGKKVLN